MHSFLELCLLPYSLYTTSCTIIFLIYCNVKKKHFGTDISFNTFSRFFTSRNDTSNECIFCTKKYATKKQLVEHTKDQHSELVFQCDVCNEILERNVLITHMTAHAKEYKQCIANKETGENVEDNGLACANCIEDLDAHSAGGRGADDEVDKTINQEIAISFPKNNTKCYICNKIFSNRSGIKYHLNQVHAKIREFLCEICKASFGAKRVLTNHITGVHLNEKNFKCRKCDKCFKTSANLFVHMKSHNTDYCFVCELCDKAYKYHHHLKEHHISVHSKQNFECELCDKIFPAAFNLFRHMKTHRVDKQYTCEKCHQVFNQKRYYLAHYKRIHADELKSESV